MPLSLKEFAALVSLPKILQTGRKEGNCLIWTGLCTDGTRPTIKIKGQRISVRRIVYALMNPADLHDNVNVLMSCGNSKCINHEHFRLGNPITSSKDRSAIMQAVRMAGNDKNKLDGALVVMRAMRKRPELEMAWPNVMAVTGE